MKKQNVYAVINADGDGFLQPNPINGIPEWGKLKTAELFIHRHAFILAKYFGGSVLVSLYAVQKED